MVGLARQVRRNEEALAGYREAMTCHLGDFAEYAALRRRDQGPRDGAGRAARPRPPGRRRARSLERLRPGTSSACRPDAGPGCGGRRRPPGPHRRRPTGPRPTVLTADRQVKRLALADFPVPVEPLDRVRVPKSSTRAAPGRARDLASTLRTAGRPTDDLRGRRRRPLAARPTTRSSPTCAAELRGAPLPRLPGPRGPRPLGRALAPAARARPSSCSRRIEGRTNTIARTFDRVCDLLTELGYLDGDTVTADGRRLRRLYTELDLLAAECLREGVWDGPATARARRLRLGAGRYEARRDDDGLRPGCPAVRREAALGEMVRIWAGSGGRRARPRARASRRGARPGLAWAVHRWAAGQASTTVLRDADLAAGDFVRWCKQVIDLLGQMAAARGGRGRCRARRAAKDAIDAVPPRRRRLFLRGLTALISAR